MNEFGHRYIEVGRFVSYCKSLNIDVSEGELEFYEKEKLLFPVARILIPEDYVRYMFDIQHNPNNPYYHKNQFELPNKWTKIYNLLERINFFVFHKDDSVHFFDKHLGKSKYLVKPIETPFREWNSYRIVAGRIGNNSVAEQTAKHFYHYWQIYQIFEIQRYLDFCCKMTLRENSDFLQKKKYPLYYHISFPKRKVADGDYLGMNNEFDALSFFIYQINRKEIAFVDKGKPIGGGLKQLSIRQVRALENADKRIAAYVCQRFDLDEDKLFVFLRKLLYLHVDYERKERAKLAREIRKDASYLVSLIMYKTGLKSLEVSKRVGRLGGYFENYLDVIFPNQIEKAKKKATPTFESFLKDYNVSFPSYQINAESLKRFLSFCEENNTLSFMSAISDINTEWFNRDSLSETALIFDLRECVCFAERLGELVVQKTRKRRIKTLIRGRITLKKVIRAFFEQEVWFNEFIGMWEERSGFDTVEEFQQKYSYLIGHNVLSSFQEKDSLFRTFLLTSLIRNYIVHRNVNFRFFEDNYILLVKNAAFVIFLLWHQVEKKRLIKFS
jgi:hypothetical protein